MKPLLSIALLALLLASCSLAADVAPPAGYQPSTPIPTEPPLQGPLYPSQAPDPARGASIFAQSCAPCHGETGLGDGPDAANLRDQNIAVPPLGMREIARLASPERWYSIVTQGNMKRFMPPFRSLSDSQRWDVVAYALSLNATAADLSAGQGLYEANCTKCHATDDVLFTDQQRMAVLTNAMIADAMASGKGKMPAFPDLSEAEREQLAVYVRSLSFAAGETLPAVETPQPGSETQSTEILTGTGTITGTITNPAGVAIPAGLTVTLYAFTQFDPHPLLAYTLTTQTAGDGTFAFEGLSWQTGEVLGAAVEYQGVLYGSSAAEMTGSENSAFLPIEVYETTGDLSGLVVDRHHVIFSFNQAGLISVMEMYAISNTSEKTVTAGPGEPVVVFPLPLGAENVEFQDGNLNERYLPVSGGVADTEPVYPGSGAYQVSFSYTLPYQDQLDFTQLINITTKAVTVLVPEGGIQIQGDALQDGGSFQGTPYHRYDAVDLAPDTLLTFSLSGQPQATGDGTTTQTAVAGTHMELAIGLGALGLVLIGLGLWFYVRTRRAAVIGGNDEDAEAGEDAAEDADTLMDAIIAIDDQFRAGAIPEEAYQRRRAELKALLASRINP